MHFIFDLDGTLVDSLEGIHEALNLSLADHGFPTTTREQTSDYIGNGSWTLCRLAVTEVADSVTDSLNEGFRKYYPETWKTGTHIYEGMTELVQSFKGQHHLSILSNKPHPFTTEIVAELFPEGLFDIVMGQKPEIDKKPNPSGIFEILKASSHDDNRAVLIGDSTVDIQTAKNAQIDSIAVKGGYDIWEDVLALEPDYQSNNSAELKAVLDQIANKI